MALGTKSQARLKEAHPLLQKLFNQVVKDYPALKFQILDAKRGKKAQNAAVARGNSKATFGNSPHNYLPCIALDVTPLPLDWDNITSFKKLSVPILATAKKLGIPISWGGTWTSLKDFPHYELTPWRTYAKQSKLYTG